MRYAWICVLVLAGCTTRWTVNDANVIDLSYAFNDQTIYWPTANGFSLKTVAWGYNDAGDWYASNDFCASEHGGTHLDAPIHFAADGLSISEIPLEQLMGPARVIDIRDQCERFRDYRLQVQDIKRHEKEYGRLPRGSIVLVLTGFGRLYSNAGRYLGSDVPGEVDDLSFPGLGEEAARLLIDRGVDLVGLDTASLDHGPSKDFIVHRVLNAAGIPGVENVANLELLPPTGATVIALPMKIDGGTGGPCRIIAILP